MADIKALEHNMSIKDRELINLDGVLSVKKFDEKEIELETHMGADHKGRKFVCKI